MSRRGGVTLCLAPLAVGVLLAGCGGGDPRSARLTLTDDDCTYDGDKMLAVGPLLVELENQSSKLSAFELSKLDAGSTFADVEAYVENEKQRLEEGVGILGPPAFLSLVTRIEVAAGESGVLPSGSPVTAGQYVLWCASEHPPTSLYLVTSLEVSE